MEQQLNKIAPSLQQPLNMQQGQRISGYKFKNKTQIEIRLGTWNISSLCGRETKMVEELRKRKVYICGLQEVHWRNKEACFIGVEGKRYQLWWSRNDAGKGCV